MAVDPRFYHFQGPRSLRTLLRMADLDIDVSGDPEISGLAPAGTAGAGDLCFVEGDAKQAAKVNPDATACVVSEAAAEGLPDGVIAVPAALPRYIHKRLGEVMVQLKDWMVEGPDPKIHPSASIAPSAHIGAGAAIGEDARIGPSAVIGPGVQIGARTEIGANASVRCALIGNDVSVHAGVVIGEAGFGVTPGPEGAEDAPQWGRVIIQDHVTLGANSCVDRGAFDDTIIGERTKVDNMVQIAHNVVIGRNVVMASFAGVSGSSTVEDGVLMGGRVGVSNHVTVGAGAQLAANTGVFRDIPPGERWGGVPAKPLRQYMREIAWIQKQIAPKKKSK